MDAFEWVDSLSSDIDKVDNQHKQLFSIMNAYFAAMSKAEASVILMESVNKLLEYANTHFKEEEYWFEKYDYPGADKHKAMHSHYLSKISTYGVLLNDGISLVDGKPITVELWRFMKDWLSNHIKVDDIEYRDYFISIDVIDEIKAEKDNHPSKNQ